MVICRVRRVAYGLFGGALVLVNGCANTGQIGPQDHTHALEPFEMGRAFETAKEGAGWPALDWYAAYGDPQLNQWIDRAKTGSPTLATAAARLHEAKAAAGVAAAALSPHLDGATNLSRHNWPANSYYGPGALGGNTTWDSTSTLTLSYDLDLWGGEKNTTLKAIDTAQAMAANRRAAELELELEIVRTYVDFSLNFALSDIAQKSLAQQRQIASLAQRRFAGGIGTQLDVSQAQASLPEAERQSEIYIESIELDRNELAALAGQGPGAGNQLTRPTLSLAAAGPVPSVLPAELLGHRPDVVAARWRVAAQARGIDVSKSGFYPNVNLLASLSQMAAGGNPLTFLSGPDRGWSAGPAITLPLFEGGRLRSQLGVASAEYDQAVDQYNGVLVAALKEITDQVVRVRSLDGQLSSANQAVADADQSYKLAMTGYRRGLTDYVNVLVAQGRLFEAQGIREQASALRFEAFAGLSAALGGGVQEPDDMAPTEVLTQSEHISRFLDRPGEREALRRPPMMSKD